VIQHAQDFLASPAVVEDSSSSSAYITSEEEQRPQQEENGYTLGMDMEIDVQPAPVHKPKQEE